MKGPIAQCVVGIDVSKDYYDAAIDGRKEVRHFEASETGKMIRWLRCCSPAIICLEASGGYHCALVEALQEAGLPVAVVNPRQIRDFARAMNRLNKTDKLDAQTIAAFAAKMDPAPTEKPSENQRKLRSLRTRREQVTQMLTQEKNRLSTVRDPAMRQLIQRAIDFYQQQQRELDQAIAELMNADPVFRSSLQLLTSTPSIGMVTASALLAAMPELGKLNRREVGRLAGIAPINRDSGTLRGKRMIGGGRPGVRRALYMATLVATRHNERIRRYYHHLLQAGKAKMVALTACMRKLLLILNAMLKNQQPWKCSEQKP